MRFNIKKDTKTDDEETSCSKEKVEDEDSVLDTALTACLHDDDNTSYEDEATETFQLFHLHSYLLWFLRFRSFQYYNRPLAFKETNILNIKCGDKMKLMGPVIGTFKIVESTYFVP